MGEYDLHIRCWMEAMEATTEGVSKATKHGYFLIEVKAVKVPHGINAPCFTTKRKDKNWGLACIIPKSESSPE